MELNKEKQIEEMARVMCQQSNPCFLCAFQTPCRCRTNAELLNAEGYRKTSDLEKEIEDLKAIAEQYQKQFEEARTDIAREIFEEIEHNIDEALKCYFEGRNKEATIDTPLAEYLSGKIDALASVKVRLAELKKKYTEGEE